VLSHTIGGFTNAAGLLSFTFSGLSATMEDGEDADGGDAVPTRFGKAADVPDGALFQLGSGEMEVMAL
jgi:hypothetical protein